MRPRHPFTLIEMVAALAVLALVAGLVVAAVRGTPLFLSLDAAAAELQAFLAQVRREALVRGVERAIQIDAAAGRLTVDEAVDAGGTPPFRVPAGAQLKLVPPDAAAQIRFFPDGTGQGPALRVERDGAGLTITVSPLTGLSHRAGDPDEP